jgi:UDP-N-acetyl-D-mannosaminuronate dehydrogenase
MAVPIVRGDPLLTAQPARRITVIGRGTVGRPVHGVNAGHAVLGLDVDQGRVERSTARDGALLNDRTTVVVTVPNPPRDDRTDVPAALESLATTYPRP